MDYIKLRKAFRVRKKLSQLSPPAIALWYALADIANDIGQTEGLTPSSKALEDEIGASKKTVQTARNTLQQKGFITWEERRGRQSASYTLIDLTADFAAHIASQNDPQPVPQPVTQGVTQPVPQPVTIYKQNKTRQNKTNVSTNVRTEQQAASAPKEAPVYSLPLNTGEEYRISHLQLDQWCELYPNVDVKQQLRNMHGWLDANKPRRKTAKGINRFIVGWLSKEQDRGGKGAVTQGYAPKGTAAKTVVEQQYNQRAYDPAEFDGLSPDQLKELAKYAES